MSCLGLNLNALMDTRSLREQAALSALTKVFEWGYLSQSSRIAANRMACAGGSDRLGSPLA